MAAIVRRVIVSSLAVCEVRLLLTKLDSSDWFGRRRGGWDCDSLPVLIWAIEPVHLNIRSFGDIPGARQLTRNRAQDIAYARHVFTVREDRAHCDREHHRQQPHRQQTAHISRHHADSTPATWDPAEPARLLRRVHGAEPLRRSWVMCAAASARLPSAEASRSPPAAIAEVHCGPSHGLVEIA